MKLANWWGLFHVSQYTSGCDVSQIHNTVKRDEVLSNFGAFRAVTRVQNTELRGVLNQMQKETQCEGYRRDKIGNWKFIQS
jgi:hypothetical protein